MNVYRKKRGIGNICYLTDLLPKSDLMRTDLHEFTKNKFLQDVLKDYDVEVERYIHNLVVDYNGRFRTAGNQELENTKKKVQCSSKFKFPWDKTVYYKAVDHLLTLIEMRDYLRPGRGEYKTKKERLILRT